MIDEMQGWVSPRTQARFGVEDGALLIYRPDGKPFEAYLELLVRAEAERNRAEQEHSRAEQESQRAEQEHTRAERLAAQLRALGVEPE